MGRSESLYRPGLTHRKFSIQCNRKQWTRHNAVHLAQSKVIFAAQAIYMHRMRHRTKRALQALSITQIDSDL